VVVFLVERSMEFTLNLASSKKRAKIRMLLLSSIRSRGLLTRNSSPTFSPLRASMERRPSSAIESGSSRRLLQEKKYPAAQGTWQHRVTSPVVLSVNSSVFNCSGRNGRRTTARYTRCDCWKLIPWRTLASRFFWPVDFTSPICS
jgi:hypothetical protein